VIIAIDPSINNIGCVLVHKNGTYADSTTIKSQGKNSEQKLSSIHDQLDSWLQKITANNDIDSIIIEHTRFFARQNNQSHASAQKLNLAKGLIYGTCKSHKKTNCHLVWIPGFNKQQADLLSRIYKAPKTISQHEKDAFWLGNTWSQTPKKQREKILADSDI
jgi:hypothetical protein